MGDNGHLIPAPWALKRGPLRDQLLGPNGEVICDWDHRWWKDAPNDAHGRLIVASPALLRLCVEALKDDDVCVEGAFLDCKLRDKMAALVRSVRSEA